MILIMNRRRMSFRPAPAACFMAVLPALFALSFLCSCSRIADYRAVMDGNRAMRGGRYEDAIVSYLSVKSADTDPALTYNIANAYARLGETKAALVLYRELRTRADRDLCEASFYNEGVLLYEKGRYGEAAASFRAALSLSPRDDEARRNYERSLRDSMRTAGASPREFLPAQKSGSGTGDEELRLLRRLETGRFRSIESAREEGYVDDY